MQVQSFTLHTCCAGYVKTYNKKIISSSIKYNEYYLIGLDDWDKIDPIHDQQSTNAT